MSTFKQAKKDHRLFLIWNASSRMQKVGVKMLRPITGPSGWRYPVTDPANAVLLHDDDFGFDTAVKLVKQKQLNIREVVSPLMLRLPFNYKVVGLVPLNLDDAIFGGAALPAAKKAPPVQVEETVESTTEFVGKAEDALPLPPLGPPIIEDYTWSGPTVTTKGVSGVTILGRPDAAVKMDVYTADAPAQSATTVAVADAVTPTDTVAAVSPWAIVDEKVVADIPWEDLMDGGDFSISELRIYGRAFSPKIDSRSKDGIIDLLVQARDALKLG